MKRTDLYLLLLIPPLVLIYSPWNVIMIFLLYWRSQKVHSPVLPCLFQRCPLMESEVTALREILEEVGVISTWILRAPSLLLLFNAAPCSVDLIALPTCSQTESHPHMLLEQTIPDSAGQLLVCFGTLSFAISPSRIMSSGPVGSGYSQSKRNPCWSLMFKVDN